MIGFAVQERCPDCKMELDIITAPPGVGVLHHRKCTSRSCRQAHRGPLVFMIRDGHARVLTGEERAAMLKATTAP